MSNRILTTVLLVLTIAMVTVAQPKDAILQYIDQFQSLAVAEMQRTGVPASIKLAQGIHETLAGTSDLVQRSNNHFGIKCKTGWSGPSVRHDDDARAECFRKYETAEASYVDHSNFLKNSPRYFSLFDLSPTDYQGWAWGLKKAGYATNPQYAPTLIRLIEEYDLNRYTLLALGRPLPAPATKIGETPAAPVVNAAAESEKKTLEPQGNTAADAPGHEVAAAGEAARYPSGVFEQDGCRAVWIKAGTPFLAIADQYRIPLSKLFAYNNMEPTLEAKRDQVLLLEKRSAVSSLRLPLRHKRSR